MADIVFWQLGKPSSVRKRADWADDHGIESIECPAYPEHKRAGRRLRNLDVLLPRHALDDIVWVWGSDCLVQESVLALFREKGFTGYEMRPAKARFSNDSPVAPPPLWELVVTGWAGVAPAESGVKLKYSCPFCGLLKYSCFDNPGQLIDPSQWDGSDFFIVWPLPKFIFITERVAATLRRAKLKGFRLVKPNELKCTSGGFGPGRLSYWMPESRARELGEPLGIY